MNTQSQKIPFFIDHFTEILHKNLKISAFRREDESNQPLLRHYKIERILFIDWIQIGTVYLKGMALLRFEFSYFDFKVLTELD